MINRIWGFMIVSSILYALVFGNMEAMTDALLTGCSDGVQLCLGIIGVYALWMGLMRLALKAGILAKLSQLLSKSLSNLFPQVPKGHEAFGYIMLNLAANMLGTGNAATPIGLRAMESLQTINKNKTIPSHAMAMFLVLNTSSVQLFPTMIVGLRTAAGSVNPTAIVVSALLASSCSTVAGIFAVKYFMWSRHNG
jgi:spore maturation protein A